MAKRWIVQIADRAGVYIGAPAPGVERLQARPASPPQLRVTSDEFVVGPAGELRFYQDGTTVLLLARGTWTSLVPATEEVPGA